jgi:hypothetical protein
MLLKLLCLSLDPPFLTLFLIEKSPPIFAIFDKKSQTQIFKKEGHKAFKATGIHLGFLNKPSLKGLIKRFIPPFFSFGKLSLQYGYTFQKI